MTTVLSRLEDHVKIRPDAPAYGRKVGDRWVTTSYRAYRDEVHGVGRALMALGLEPGGIVGILSFNRPEWVISALGTMAAGGSPAGIYTTSAARQVAYILRHGRCPIVVVEDAAQWEKIRASRDELPDLAWTVVMDPTGLDPALLEPASGASGAGPAVLAWSDFLARAGEITEASLLERRRALKPEQVATLIYTSGTTGRPKSVMLTHRNTTETARIVRDVFDLRPGRALSYLPLAHVAEQMLTIHVSILLGSTIYYAAAPETVASDLREIRPTLFFGVPRVWERFHAGITSRLRQATGARRRLAEWAMEVSRRVLALRNRGDVPGALLRARYRLADRLVLAKVRRAVGFGEVEICASGAAPIPPAILEFFSGLGLTIYEVWGLSETSGPATWSRPGRVRFGTVGPALPEVDVKLAADGEVLVRGPNVFAGYLDDPEITAETLVDGWLHTGDLGRFDDDAYLTITGRKKEILVTSGGKNIAPNALESALREIDLVADAVVLGDGRRCLTALLSLEVSAAARLAEEQGLAGHVPEGELYLHPKIREALEAAIGDVNRGFARVEHIRDFRVLPRALSVEHGELTPTLKVKRRKVEEQWADLIEEMYRE